MISEAISSTGTGLSIFRTLRDEFARGEVKRIVRNLRTIYFMPRGVLSALREAREGQLDVEQARATLQNFSGDDPEVWKAVFDIRSENISDLRINLEQREFLHAIGDRKVTIRGQVKALLSDLANGEMIPVDDLDALIANISEINKEVAAIDAELSRRL